MITPTHYMLLSGALHLGVVGVMMRRNVVVILCPLS